VLCQTARTRTGSATGARNRKGVQALTDSVRVCALELAASTFHVGHAALTSEFMGSVFHLNPGLRVTVGRLAIEKGAVAALEDIDFWV